ncbi:MAG: FAD-dependent thymidylate synthase [Deltaproteobacteria bacterium]|jgi:thymidylate synthase (FAD)|nr:FAD-dependent thymidylate synthase [Deltaproteobacteria bacterium]
MTKPIFRHDIPKAKLWTPLDRDAVLRKIEAAGRTCYASEPGSSIDEAAEFVRRLVRKGHESVLEHESASFLVTCSRACSHQLVRHRLCAYSQESQRFVRHGEDKPLEFYVPPAMEADQRELLEEICNIAALNYWLALPVGRPPQEARMLLPNATVTRLMVTANLRQWRHMIRQRTSPQADAEIRELFWAIGEEFQRVLPEIFGEEER